MAAAPAQKNPKRSTARPAARPAAAKEKGTDLLAALMRLVEEKVEGVKRVPNASHTYTRLQVDGKTFAYVYPPRKTGLAVKIPKQLMEVKAKLPDGHGFKETGWGLTRTITKAAEAPKAAAALAVAAAEVAKATSAEA